MHTVKLDTPINTPRWDLDAGTWIAEDISALELGIDADRGTAHVNEFQNYDSLEPKCTLLVANGGFGDMLMWTPAFREFKKQWPNHRLILATRKRVHPIFDGLDYAPVLFDYPVNFERLLDVDRVVTSEHIQESSEEGRTVPAIDLKAKLLGVGLLVGDQRKIEYIVTDAERAWACDTYPRMTGPNGPRKRIGIQLVASSPTRTYHKTRMEEVMTLLYNRGYEILLFGAPGSLPLSAIPSNRREFIKNLTVDNLTFRQSAAVAQTCDCLFVPDSSLMHVAEALQIPCVAIFGSTGWKQRISGEGTVVAIQSNMGCPIAPCYFHPKGRAIFPADQQCSKEGYCGPLNAIQADTIVAKIEKQLSKYAK